MLEQFAQAAVEHTANHASKLAPLQLQSLDAVLDQIRSTLLPEELESMAVCYGSFLAQELVSLGARWGNADSPVAPRIALGGKWVSPIDEVRRRLLQPQSLPLVELVHQTSSGRDECSNEDLLRHNANAWNERASDPQWAPSTLPRLTQQEATQALDPWLRPSETFSGIADKQVLCIAAAGGTHGPLHAMAGADVTVVDLSEAMLAKDRRAAAELGIQLKTSVGCMTNPDFASNSFDVAVQPVSSCYVRSLDRMYRSIASILRPGGIYLIQHKTASALQVAYDAMTGNYTWIHSSKDNIPANSPSLNHEAGTLEFSHSAGEIFGGLCEAGFSIEAVEEPVHSDAWAPVGTLEHFAQFAQPYLKIKAVKRDK